VIPEPVFRREDYEREVLGRMYADVAPLDPEGILQDEFLNSRGAIPRFGRGSIEIRVIDVQESPVADLALAALAVGTLRLLTEERLSPLSLQQSLAVPDLAAVFLDCVREGERAVVGNGEYLRSLGMGTARASAQDVWWHLLEKTADAGLLRQEGQEDRLRALLRRGPLARQILQALELPAGRSPDSLPTPSRESLVELYRSLAACLQSGEIFVV
jgi:hypothetical protein